MSYKNEFVILRVFLRKRKEYNVIVRVFLYFWEGMREKSLKEYYNIFFKIIVFNYKIVS